MFYAGCFMHVLLKKNVTAFVDRLSFNRITDLGSKYIRKKFIRYRSYICGKTVPWAFPNKLAASR